MTSPQAVRIGHSCSPSPAQAVAELAADLRHSDTSLVIFFCSYNYDRDVLSAAIKRHFGTVLVLGCTTAGEIGNQGLTQQSLVGISFSSTDFTISAALLSDLQQFCVKDGQVVTKKLLQQLRDKGEDFNAEHCFGFLMIDGLSVREEPVTYAVQSVLANIAMIGGSAGDGMRFRHTYVYYDGEFYTDSAVLLLIHTRLPFKIFKAQHFLPTAERLVVTLADTARRVVYEINGLPAAPEYARLIGVAVEVLNPTHFAAAPVVVAIDGTYYVRAIRSANPDNSLTFYCAIEEGLVLRIAQGVDPIETLQQAFAEVRAEIGQPLAVLGCDCILRKLELAHRGLTSQAEQLLLANKVVGFNTYGEQFCGVHVNQTFAAVAIGADAKYGNEYVG